MNRAPTASAFRQQPIVWNASGCRGAIHRALFASSPLLLASLLLACRTEPPPGLAVIEAHAGGAAARAGLVPGDRLLRLSAPDHPPRPLTSCLDLALAEVELGPRGGVRIERRHASGLETVSLPPGGWWLEVEPGAGPAGEVCRQLSAAADATEEAREEQAFAAALAAAHPLPNPEITALVEHRLALARLGRDALEPAHAAVSAALATRRQRAAASLATAASWHVLGQIEQRRGRRAGSDAAFEEARRIREKAAPESLELAWTWMNLGINAYLRQDFGTTRAFYDRAHTLIERLWPESTELAGVLSNQGLLARETGDLARAEERLRAAVTLYERLDPDGDDTARSRVNLALVAMDRGDLAPAEELQRQALAHFEGRAPASLAVAQILENLGKIARDRSQYAEAEVLLRRSLELRRRLAPASAAENRSLAALAWVVFRRGRLDDAEALAREVVSRSGSDDDLETSSSLHALAEVAGARGRVEDGLALLERALVGKRRGMPGSIRLAVALQTRAELASRAGRRALAEASFAEAIELFERLAPDSFQLAWAFGGWAEHLERTGREPEAVRALASAIAALEAQISRLGGADEARAAFQQEHGTLYQRLLRLELALGEPAAAFATWERSRGRNLQVELLRRQEAFRGELAPARGAEQRRLDRAYDAAQRELALTVAATTGARRAELLAELAELRLARAAAREEVERAAPRYAALRFPRALELAELARTVPPGTLWLAFSVADEETVLFGLDGGDAGSLEAQRLPLGAARLAEEVALLRSLVLAGRQEPSVSAALEAQARRLYQLLLAPLEARLARAERLLISPDGPLHALPWSALVLPSSPRRFVVERWPNHQVLSGSVLAQLTAGREREEGERPSVVLAAPTTAGPPDAGAELGAAGPALERYRAGFPPLPWARAEGEAVAASASGVGLWLGREASEARAKSLPVRVGFAHFAAHALLDRASPLDSGLALATPRRGEAENGLLQAWEVFDQLRLEADLVVLSGCETALGGEGGGEGLIGLARAFQFAGARSVLAAQWQVADRSTAGLLARLHALRAAGASTATALARAQREQIAAGGPSAHPYHWAGFVLSGADDRPAPP